MNTFALKGTFLDTPAPDTLRVREGYLLCENGLCARFSETAPAGVEVLDYTGKIITPGLVDLHLHAPQPGRCLPTRGASGTPPPTKRRFQTLL